jgi:hypothetical protein
MNRSLDTPQLNKIRGACAKARQETPPLKWVWNDTCCINKTNAVEEARSINSMFEWYSNATVWYAYLHDVVWSASGCLPLNYWRYNAGGEPLTIVLQLIKINNVYKREQCHALGQKKRAKPSCNRVLRVDQIFTRPVIITQPDSN